MAHDYYKRLLQPIPDTEEAVTEEAQSLVGALEPFLDDMIGYERTIVGNIKKAESCNRSGLIFLRAAADRYLKDEGDSASE